MSHIEEVNIGNVKQSQDKAKQAQKEKEKVDTKLRVKASKRPVTQPSPEVAQAASAPSEFDATEYKLAVPMLLIESVSKLAPKYINASENRLRQRLLQSPDIGLLAERAFAGIDIKSDKLKFMATMLYHLTNEWLQSSLTAPADTPASAVVQLEEVTPAA